MALKLSEQYIADPEIRETSLIYLMLRDMVVLLDELEFEKVPKKKTDSINVLPEIIELLVNKDMDNAILKVHEYLTSIGKEKYEFLVAGLIKISILEEDVSFSKSMLLLNELNKGDISFNVSEYISYFYDSVSNKKFKEARIYLDIIGKSKDFGTPDNLVESLNKMLEILGKSRESENDSQLETVDYINDEDYISLTEKAEYLIQKHGVIILDPMDSKHRKKIHGLVEKFPNMASFSIGEGDERRIVLRYISSEWIDADELKPNHRKRWSIQDYKQWVNYYKAVISLPKPYIASYYRLGVVLGKIGSYEESLDMLTIAYHLFDSTTHLKDEKSQAALLDLINKTKDKIEQTKQQPEQVTTLPEETSAVNEERNVSTQEQPSVVPQTDSSSKKAKRKPKSHGKIISHFLGNVTPAQEYFGITKIDEISIMINDMEMSITDACSRCNLTDEETSLVRLIYARDCYSQGNYETGDRLFKIVERSKDKTPRLKFAIDEIRRSKPFYVHRQEAGKQLLKSFKVKN